MTEEDRLRLAVVEAMVALGTARDAVALCRAKIAEVQPLLGLMEAMGDEQLSAARGAIATMELQAVRMEHTVAQQEKALERAESELQAATRENRR